MIQSYKVPFSSQSDMGAAKLAQAHTHSHAHTLRLGTMFSTVTLALNLDQKLAHVHCSCRSHRLAIYHLFFFFLSFFTNGKWPGDTKLRVKSCNSFFFLFQNAKKCAGKGSQNTSKMKFTKTIASVRGGTGRGGGRVSNKLSYFDVILRNACAARHVRNLKPRLRPVHNL